MLCLQIFGFDDIIERKDVIQLAPSTIALTALILAVFQYRKNNRHNIDTHHFEEAKHLLNQIEKMSLKIKVGTETDFYNISYHTVGLSNYYSNLQSIHRKISDIDIKKSIGERVMSFNIMQLQDITLKMQPEILAKEQYIDEIIKINNHHLSSRYNLYFKALSSEKFYNTKCLHDHLDKCIELVLFIDYPCDEIGKFFSEDFLKKEFPFLMAIRSYKIKLIKTGAE